jgi:fructose-bisphosphate aldolase class I
MQSEKKCFRQELAENAKKIGRPGFGILAADESTGTIGKKFVTINLENTFDNRRKYRELLFTTPDIENYISGVILYDETARQSSSTGQ